MQTLELVEPSLFQSRCPDRGVNSMRRLRRMLLPSQARFDLHRQLSPERADVEDYIAAKFAEEYGAELYHFLPRLLTMRCQSRTSAAVGIDMAENNSLFVEHYLDQPIERELELLGDCEVARSEVVEIGNLVASHRGASQLLFVVLASALGQAGYRWVVFTATPQVGRIFAKLHCPTLDLGCADPGRLGADAGQWGSYYATEPRVTAVDLTLALDTDRVSLPQKMLLRLLAGMAGQLAEQL